MGWNGSAVATFPLGRPESMAFVFSESDHEHLPDGQDGYIICSVWYNMKMWALPLELRISSMTVSYHKALNH